jgi:hypothetical protein
MSAGKCGEEENVKETKETLSFPPFRCSKQYDEAGAIDRGNKQ